MCKLDLNMQIGKTQKQNKQLNTVQTKKGENKYILSYRYTQTHTIKITKIILGKGITNWKLVFQLSKLVRDIGHSSSLVMVATILGKRNGKIKKKI